MTMLPPIDEILWYACRAPSVHNTQPWRWRFRGSGVELHEEVARRT